MFNNILVELDGSEHAKQAAQKAAGLAKKLGDVNIYLIHVTAVSPPKSKLVEANFNVEKVLKEIAYEKLAKTLTVFRMKDLGFTLEVAIGEAAEEIVKLSNEKKIDLIILGSRGLNTFGEVIFGSVSHQVLHEATCPVMVVKNG